MANIGNIVLTAAQRKAALKKLNAAEKAVSANRTVHFRGMSREQEKVVLAFLRGGGMPGAAKKVKHAASGKKAASRKGTTKHSKASHPGRKRHMGPGTHCGINVGPARKHTKGLLCNGYSKRDCKKVGSRMSKHLKHPRTVCA